MATQASEDVGREVVVEAESENGGTPQAADTEQISTSNAVGSSSVADGEHMFIETEVYTTTVDYVGNTELVQTDEDPSTRQDEPQQQSEILEQVRATSFYSIYIIIVHTHIQHTDKQRHGLCICVNLMTNIYVCFFYRRQLN